MSGNKKSRVLLQAIIALTILVLITAVFAYIFKDKEFLLLTPKGIIAEKQRNLFVGVAVVGLFAVMIVFVLTGFIAWKYRASNKKSDYKPEWDSSRLLETAWWGLPILLIGSLAVITWFTTHDLDPHKAISSSQQTKTIQVVAMRWKWLFIYPDEKIASLNYLALPENVPIKFEITSDAPMNSLWIPELGGQMYAMSGMSTTLYLEANQQGRFLGMSSNISGTGFASMNFTAESLSDTDYQNWVESAKSSQNILNFNQYQKLAEPSENDVEQVFILEDEHLYSNIISKYTMPGNYTLPEQYHTGDNHNEGED